MKSKIIQFALVLSVISLMSFTTRKDEGVKFSSTYSFTRSGEQHPQIKLELKDDGSFIFIDRSNPRKQVEASGKYIIKGRMLKFYDCESTWPISRRWKLDTEYDCIKSRRGLEFTRICHGSC